MTIQFEVDGVPPPMNIIQRKYRNHHARHKLYKMWYQRVFMAVRGMIPPEPFKRAKLTFIVFLPPKKFRDWDGIVASLKPVADSLRMCGIIKDDNYKVTGPWDVTQVPCKDRPDGFMRIIIQNMEGQEDENPYHQE